MLCNGCADELRVSAWIVDGDRSLSEGHTAVLECQSDSHGDVRLVWMKDGEQLGQDDDGRVHETEGRSTLTLTELTSADAGEYVCVATRDHESVSSTPLSISVTGQTFLTITSPPNFQLL